MLKRVGSPVVDSDFAPLKLEVMEAAVMSELAGACLLQKSVSVCLRSRWDNQNERKPVLVSVPVPVSVHGRVNADEVRGLLTGTSE